MFNFNYTTTQCKDIIFFNNNNEVILRYYGVQ